MLLLFCSVIETPREPLLKEVGLFPRREVNRLCRACCDGSVWERRLCPAPAGLDRVRQGRRSRQPGRRRVSPEIPEFAPTLPIETDA